MCWRALTSRHCIINTVDKMVNLGIVHIAYLQMFQCLSFEILNYERKQLCITAKYIHADPQLYSAEIHTKIPLQFRTVLPILNTSLTETFSCFTTNHFGTRFKGIYCTVFSSDYHITSNSLINILFLFTKLFELLSLSSSQTYNIYAHTWHVYSTANTTENLENITIVHTLNKSFMGFIITAAVRIEYERLK